MRSRDLRKYSWNHGAGDPGPRPERAWATSSSVVVALLERTTLVPSAEVARATSSSPSPPASFWYALGATAMGIS